MSQRLKFASLIVRAPPGLHADHTSWLLLKECEQLIATQLPTHENPTHVVDTVDLKDALREIDTDRGKLGHEWILRWEHNILDYDVVSDGSRSHPSHQSRWRLPKIKALLRTAAARTVSDLWVTIRQAFTRFTPAECRNDLEAAGYDAYDPS